jgi:hypothetical protein
MDGRGEHYMSFILAWEEDFQIGEYLDNICHNNPLISNHSKCEDLLP